MTVSAIGRDLAGRSIAADGTAVADDVSTSHYETTSLQCPCGHASDRHDPIASRYCDATQANQLHRQCICVSAAATVAT